MVSGAAGASGGAAADRLAQAHARLLLDHSLQFSFATIPPPRIPAWLKSLVELLGHIAPALKWVFWGGLALTVAMILFFVGRELIRLRWPEKRRPKPKAAEAEWRPTPERARVLLEDADRMAAQGRYAEAAHLLLHRSIEDIQGRRPRAVGPSLTSRDIAELDSLPAAARPLFARIAEVVERSFFGGRDVDAAAFADCRRAYEAFAFPEAWA